MNERILKIFASIFLASSIIVSVFIFTAIFNKQEIYESPLVKSAFDQRADAAVETLQLDSQSNLISNPNLSVSDSSQLPAPSSQLPAPSSSSSNSWLNNFLINTFGLKDTDKVIIKPGSYFDEDAQFLKDLNVSDNALIEKDAKIKGDLRIEGEAVFKEGVSIDDELKVNGIKYLFPESQIGGILTNDGDGGLTWTTSQSAVTLAGSLDYLTLSGQQITLNQIDISTDVSGALLDINELNILNGATLSTAELNILDGVTSTFAELNFLDGTAITAGTAGGVLFNDGTKITHDSANLFWNDSTNRLGIGTTAPTQVLDIAYGNLAFTPVTAPTALTATVGAAGILTGNYYYKVTYVTAIGETDLGTVSVVVAPSSQKVELSAIPISSNPAVTQRKIYRTKADGTFYFFLTTIADNTTTTYTDNIADASIGVGENTSGSTYRSNTTTGTMYVGGVKWGQFYEGGHMVALGSEALLNNTSGFNNIAIGGVTMLHNTTGYKNVAVGSAALQNNYTGYANTAVGYQALANVTGASNVGLGYMTLFSNISGDHNVSVGSLAGYKITTGQQNVFIGGLAGQSASQKVDASNSIAIGYNVYTTASNQVVIGNSSITQTLLQGSVGIGTTAPGSKLSIVGLNTGAGTALVIDANGNVLKDSSSERYKEDIKDLDLDFSKVLSLEPKSYKFKDSDTESIGYIAEQAEELGLNDLLIFDSEGRVDGFKYDRLPIYNLELIKDLNSRIDDLENEILALGGVEINVADDSLKDKFSLSEDGSVLVIETDLKVEGEVEASKFKIDKDEGSIGQVTISAGEDSITVASDNLTEDSFILVTPNTPIPVSAEKTGEDEFEIKLDKSYENEIKVDWWIMN